MKIAHETNPKLIPTPDPVCNGPSFLIDLCFIEFSVNKIIEGEQECLAEIARSELVEESFTRKPRKIVTIRRIGASGKPMIHVVKLRSLSIHFRVIKCPDHSNYMLIRRDGKKCW